jgi:hypothetical protein
MNKTAQEVAAYIRAIVKNEVGAIKSVRKISESYHWYTGKAGSLKRQNAWRYKYYIPELIWNDTVYDPIDDTENKHRLMDAYKLINGMAPKLKAMFGYTVVAEFSRYDFSLIYRVTPANQ